MGGVFRNRGWSDRETNLRRNELLGILKTNRTKHVEEYNKAVAGYKEEAIDRIQEEFAKMKTKVEELKKGSFLHTLVVGFTLPAPVSYEKVYDQAIRMMELETDEIVKLTADQFACFVMDDWDWKEGWETTTAGYQSYLANKSLPVGGGPQRK